MQLLLTSNAGAGHHDSAGAQRACAASAAVAADVPSNLGMMDEYGGALSRVCRDELARGRVRPARARSAA
ncbi:hypothetical protein EVAR_41168_1 [Eumeta japonica]|uniref:Uncharacterized protein n=1 Tax=Eumeta variegata TaxID=151549 RepID=A0A4C1Y9G4_EUMVA|nr:hypothetical protein EVAR_41168_1 [Eumeta japonica]